MKNKELNSLIEHIQLNKAGWFTDGIKGIIKQVYGERNNNAFSLEQIKEILSNYEGINFKGQVIEKAFNSLVSEKLLLSDENNKYKLSENVFDTYKKHLDEFETIENETKAYFVKLLNNYLPGFNNHTLWEDFIKLLIQPIISKMGAKSLEIITGSYQEINYDNDLVFFSKI